MMEEEQHRGERRRRQNEAKIDEREREGNVSETVNRCFDLLLK
jgi:hypothetical protein